MFWRIKMLSSYIWFWGLLRMITIANVKSSMLAQSDLPQSDSRKSHLPSLSALAHIFQLLIQRRPSEPCGPLTFQMNQEMLVYKLYSMMLCQIPHRNSEKLIYHILKYNFISCIKYYVKKKKADYTQIEYTTEQ